MTHYFISCYFNVCQFSRRRTLTQEFIKRYPNVIVFEIAYGNNDFQLEGSVKLRSEKFTGWETCRLINWFVSVKHFKSITFIDSDVILYDGFFEKVVKKVESYEDEPVFIQPYDRAQNLYENKKYIGEMVDGCIKNCLKNRYFSNKAHTGLVYTYNKAFFSQVKRLPETLVLGGYDTVLYLSILREEVRFADLLMAINNEMMSNELSSFYDSCVGVRYDYL